MDKIDLMQEKLKIAQDFAGKILEIIQADVQMKITGEDNKIFISFDGKDVNLLIGYRGELLNSLQYILSIIINKEKEEFFKVIMDCGDYRQKREDTLKALAKKLAEKAVRTARPVKIEPMCPQERKIIHSVLQENEDVSTVSSGNEPNRFLTIIPKNTSQIFDQSNRFDNNSKGNKNFIDKKDRRQKDRFGKRDGRDNGGGSGKFENRSEPRMEKRATSFLGFGSFLGNSKSANTQEYERQKAAFFESEANKIEE